MNSICCSRVYDDLILLMTEPSSILYNKSIVINVQINEQNSQSAHTHTQKKEEGREDCPRNEGKIRSQQ